MKHLFRTAFCGALLLAALVFGGGTASAHTMPDSEWRLLCDAVGGDGAGVIEFGVGMPLQYAEDFLGSGFDEEEKTIEFFRLVYYKYPGITFCGEMQKSDKRPPGEAPIVFISNAGVRTSVRRRAFASETPLRRLKRCTAGAR